MGDTEAQLSLYKERIQQLHAACERLEKELAEAEGTIEAQDAAILRAGERNAALEKDKARLIASVEKILDETITTGEYASDGRYILPRVLREIRAAIDAAREE